MKAIISMKLKKMRKKIEKVENVKLSRLYGLFLYHGRLASRYDAMTTSTLGQLTGRVKMTSFQIHI